MQLFLIVIISTSVGCGNKSASNIDSVSKESQITTEEMHESNEYADTADMEEPKENIVPPFPSYESDDSEWSVNTVETVTIEGFTYNAYISKDGMEALIYRIDTNNVGEVSCLNIPKQINGKKVTSLGWYGSIEDIYMLEEASVDGRNIFGDEVVFEEDTMELHYPVNKIIIPESVEEIREYSFAFMDKLESITIKKGVKDIAEGICYGCNNLKKISLAGSIENIASSAFANCKKIKKITIPKDNEFFKISNECIVRKKDDAIVYCYSNKKNYYIEDGIKTIATKAFANCSMKNIYVPASVEMIEEYAFDMVKNFDRLNPKSNNIENIIIDEENEFYEKDGQTIFDKRDNSLVVVIIDNNSSYVMSDKVVKIDDRNSVINYNWEKKSVEHVYVSKNLKQMELIDGFGMGFQCENIHFQSEKIPQIIVNDEQSSPLPVVTNIYVPKAAEKQYKELYSRYMSGERECISLVHRWNVE